ncbi:putative glycerol kinase 5 [Aplysia californica]|uniref:Glycerol kinase 5 n=1 Tax=Aplysia californica TaxID=6500 RepID=A0ABM0K126_APLCA|nr:putative glycerol kinase 5 [Aplysia californica]
MEGQGDSNKNQIPQESPSIRVTGTDGVASGSGDSAGQEQKYVLALDVGTTTLRSHVYDKAGQVKGSSWRPQEIQQPEPGWSEMDPKKLLEDVCFVVTDSIKASGLEPQQISCMGISTMRGTFLTWDRETGEPFHNLITWQDLRASDYVSVWNKSFTLRALNTGASILHTLLRKKRHLAASVLRFMSKQVTMRLLWVLDNVPNIRKRIAEGNVMFGCTDTWLLWKLTGGSCHATDYSCASATGLFDPFQMEWSTIVCGLVNIPMCIFPEIRDTSGDFGVTDRDVIGFEIPITAVVADQQGSMFGHCCFDVGDVKCTLGTGTFIDLNTGSKPHASVAGLYPIVGWKIGKEVVYLAEGVSADTGNVMTWAESMGLFEDVSETSEMAESVPDSGGVYFVSAFSGLQAPFNDDLAVTSMFGMTPNTTKAHIVRAILECVAFRFKALYETALTETKLPLSQVRVDGGVAGNDFVVQLMSDLVNQTIDRSDTADMSALGAAYLAGLASGVWSSKEEVESLRKHNRQFEPRHTWPSYKKLYFKWEDAILRSKKWYPGL